MLHMQIDAFGPSDSRCYATGNKITMLQSEGSTDIAAAEDRLEDVLALSPQRERADT